MLFTYHTHVCMSLPFVLFTIAETFQVPVKALEFVYDASVVVWLVWISNPLMYHVTSTVWLIVIQKVLETPSVSTMKDVTGLWDIIIGVVEPAWTSG